MLSAFAVRPPWEVAGVDYAVGVPSGTVLKDPSTIVMTGVSVNTSTHVVTVSGNNITLDGYNFSLSGGWQVLIAGTGDTIKDSYFKIGANNQEPITATSSGLGSALINCELDGSNVDPGSGSLISNIDTVEYCYLHNAGGDVIDYGNPEVIEYNLIADTGTYPNQHSDWIQLGSGPWNVTIDFNTWYQDGSTANGIEATQGIGITGFGAGQDFAGQVNNNTIVYLPGATSSYMISVASQYVTKPQGVTVLNNYMANLQAPGNGVFFYTNPANPLVTYSDNVDMANGDYVLPNDALVAPVRVTGVVASPSSGIESPGNTITLKVNLSGAVTVSGGTPTLSLNDGGTATYVSGSGTSALTFSYTVSSSDSAVSALAITAVNLPNGANIYDAVGNAPNLAGALVTFSGLQVAAASSGAPRDCDTENPLSGDLNAGKVVTLTLSLSKAVTVAGGTPTLTLNDGGTATYTGGSGTSALTFSYTVLAGQNTPDLMTTAVNLNGATIKDGAGNAANLSLSGIAQGSPQIDTTPPTISSIVESPSSGDLSTGSSVTLTLDMNEVVTVNTTGGKPTLTLNDGGTATYTSGSGTNALTFSYTVAAGQTTAALAATAVNLNGATVSDGAGNAANLSLTGLTQIGPQINTTTTTTISSYSTTFPATEVPISRAAFGSMD